MNRIVRLTGPDLDGQSVCCLGSQLVRIVELLGDREGGLTWRIFDIDAIPRAESLMSHGSLRDWRSEEVVRLGGMTDQFLRGVFVASRPGPPTLSLRNDIDTEDPVDVDLRGAVAEIRAFDTSFFEIITEDRALAEYLANRFGVPMSE